MFDRLITSWRSTLVAVIVAVLSFFQGTVSILLDGNPETQPDFQLLVAEVAVILLGLIVRDSKVTDEEAHGMAKPAQFKNKA